jgi:hypothetical protein
VKKLHLLPEYSMPIFADGNIFLRVDDEDGKRVITHAVAVRGDTREEQEAFIEKQREQLGRYIAMFNLLADWLPLRADVIAGETPAMGALYQQMAEIAKEIA